MGAGGRVLVRPRSPRPADTRAFDIGRRAPEAARLGRSLDPLGSGPGPPVDGGANGPGARTTGSLLRPAMSRTLLLIAVLLTPLATLGAGCATGAGGPPDAMLDPVPDQFEDEADYQRQRAEAEEALDAAIGDAETADVSACRVVATSEQACGGPTTFAVYSAEASDAAEVERLAARLVELDQVANRQFEYASTCMAYMPPEPVLPRRPVRRGPIGGSPHTAWGYSRGYPPLTHAGPLRLPRHRLRRRRALVRPPRRRPRHRVRGDEEGVGREQHELRPGRHRGRHGPRRRRRGPRPGHARRRRRALPRGRRADGRRGGAGADPRPHRPRCAVRPGPRRRPSSGAGGRPLRGPDRPRGGHDGARGRARAAGGGPPERDHHGPRVPLRRQPPHRAPAGRADGAGRRPPLLRGVRARQPDGRRPHGPGQGHAAGGRRGGPGLPAHDEPDRRDRRRDRDGVPGQGRRREHGVHPVPPHEPLPARGRLRRAELPHHGGRPRRRRAPDEPGRRAVHAGLRRARGARARATSSPAPSTTR